MDFFLGIPKDELKKKKGYETAREISQQADSLMETFKIVSNLRNVIDLFLSPLLKDITLRIIMTGAGTSAFIGNSIASELGKKINHQIETIPTTDLVSNPTGYFNSDRTTLLVSYARSGNSPESLATIELADKIIPNCFHLIITCDEEGSLYQKTYNNKNVLAIVMPQRVNDKGFAMTSSFTSMLMASYLIFGNQRDISRLTNIVSTFIQNHLDYIDLLARDSSINRVVYLGSGDLKGVAQESALKLLELTGGKIIGYHESCLGFRHGPKSIVDCNTLIIIYLSNDPYTQKYDLDLYLELKNNNVAAKIIPITVDLNIKESFFIQEMNEIPAIELPFIYILFAQIYSFLRSYYMDNTPDNPCQRGDINRVVKGVKIYPLT